MTIDVGDKMPSGSFGVMKPSGPDSLSTEELFAGKKVVLFSVPGAFTPTCSKGHLPGFLTNAKALAEKGIDTIACTAVNDVFVMSAWAQDRGVDNKIVMLADGNGDYARALGLELDGTGFGMGVRGQRFAIVVDAGVVTHLAVDAPGEFNVSKAEAVLDAL